MHEEVEQSASECISELAEATTKQKKEDPFDFLIVTQFPQKTYKFQWIIRQFSTLSESKELYSTDIQISDISCFQLKLVKYENGFGLFHVNKVQSNGTNVVRSKSSSNVFGTSDFTIVKSRKPEEAPSADDFILNLVYQVSAVDSRGKELMIWSVCFPDDNLSTSYEIGEYINNTLKKFPDDSLILNCNLNANLTPVTEKIKISSKPSLECNSWNKLSMDLKALYQDSLDTDVTLIVGTDKIRAHKLILTARSPIFKKIFHHDMKEAEQNSVIITDVQFSALQRLVEFLYAGIILDGEKDMNLQELFDLYYAAGKYEIIDLRVMVGNSLMSRTRVDNASETLVWADRHNDTDLKSRLMNFIGINFEDVYNTDAWDSCVRHHPRLALEVIDFCLKKA
ncbi:uncharacterized protein LOC129988544 [Argiope bruennichi]|uniref:uncharacterized protein LOC129988544 n=1 Tax=Argiope bruennichi TaxID=94029 RepID=UPI002494996A|nr:uncharacterized protein LOC129988544 [Argiope bruennichi]